MKRLVLLVVLAMVAVACGTMEPDSSFQALNGVAASTGGSAGSGGSTQGQVQPGQTATSPGGAQTGSATQTSTPGESGSQQGAQASSGGQSTTGQPTTGINEQTGGGSGGGSTGSSGRPNFASDVGVTSTSITIGNITGVSGALGPEAFGVTLAGLRVWVDAVNAQGGINGRKVVLDFCDDGQDASQNLACSEELIPKSFAFIGNNSLSSAVSANYEYKAGIPDLGFPLNNGYYKYPNMFSNEGTDYPRDGKQVGFNGNLENTVGVYKWLALNRGITRAAYFFYTESTSQQQGKAQEQDAATVGIKTVYEGGGSQGENLAAPNFDSDVVAMQHMGANAPQAIFDTMDVDGNQKLCTAMDRYGFKVTAKVSTIEVWDQSVGGSGWSTPCRDEVYVATDSLSYADTQFPQVAAYVKAFDTYAPPSTLQAEWSLQGWATGVMFADGVAAMGADVTRKGFISWLDNLPPLDIPTTYTDHGLTAPFSYRVDNPNMPRADCNVVAQWQDSAGTFVTRAPLSTCYNDALVPTVAIPDGS